MGVKRENIKQFYKITIPYDWEITRIGKHVTKIGSGSTPRGGEKVYTSNGIPFIRSQNVNNNQLLLKNLKYIPESIHLKMSRSRVIANDILLNITGASIGRTCVVPNNFKEGNVNQHVCIIRTTKGLYNHFLQLYLFSNIGQIAILKSQVGGNREGLNHSNVRSLKVPLPPLPEQKTIAKALGLMDKAININNKLIAQKELRKKWLMQNLLSGKKRLKGFSGEWEEVKLGDLLDYQQPTKYLVENTIYNNSYSIPVLTAGKTFILGYTNENEGICRDLPIIIFDDFTTSSKYVDFPFKAKSSAMKLLKSKPNANLKFIYGAMQLIKFEVGGHQRHWISKFTRLTISCPPFKEQIAIAQILMAIDKELNLLKVKTEKLKEQKKGMMQVLLTGEKRLNLDLED